MGWAITADSALAVLTTAKHRQTPYCGYKGVAQQHIALAVCTRKSSLMEVSGIRSLMEKLSCVRGCRYFAERASTSAGTWCLLCCWPRAYIGFYLESTVEGLLHFMRSHLSRAREHRRVGACAHTSPGRPSRLRHCRMRLVLEREGEQDPRHARLSQWKVPRHIVLEPSILAATSLSR